MSLCPVCSSISVPSLICKLEHDVPDWWEQLNSKSKPRGMVHHRDARQLSISAAGGCQLCAMIIDALLQYDGNQFPWRLHQATTTEPMKERERDHLGQHLINSPIYLRPNYDPLRQAQHKDEVLQAAYIRGFKVFVPVDHGILTGHIRFFAHKGTRSAR